MKGAAADLEALDQAVVFLNYFNVLPGPWHRRKVICPLDQVLLLCVLGH